MDTVLVATWGEGLYRLGERGLERELAEEVTGLAPDGAGGALAIVGGRALRRRSADGRWSNVARATAAVELAACTKLGDAIFVGTNDARVLRVDGDALVPCGGFERVAGRETWYAGTAVVDGRVVGPPLGVRSMCGTSDGATLLVNVHVGGIPRSVDGGATWTPTIDVGWDAHEVVAHPTRARLVAAATAEGLAVSEDGGATWTLYAEGLHAKHCSAAAFIGDAVWVSASTDPFTRDGAVYRLAPGERTLRRVELPVDGRVDTGCIAARNDDVVVADTGGHAHRSRDGGATWTLAAEGVPYPTGVRFIG